MNAVQLLFMHTAYVKEQLLAWLVLNGYLKDLIYSDQSVSGNGTGHTSIDHEPMHLVISFKQTQYTW
jgi:hypothetical protein